MRYIALVAAFAVLALAPIAAHADGPPGSYKGTCKHVKVSGDDLTARCKDMSGHYHDTSLDHFQQCRSEIANTNGTLTCNHEERHEQHGPRLYSESCRDGHVENGTLYATCQNFHGDWVAAQIEHNDHCVGNIMNTDGQLQCQRDEAFAAGSVPNGSYQKSCRQSYVRGNMLIAKCETANGGWNDTTLDDVQRCRGDIFNQNGVLGCERGDDHGRDHDHDR